MQILLRKNTEPKKKVALAFAVVDPDGRAYLNGGRSLFDDYGVTALLDTIRKDFTILDVRYRNIDPLDPERKGD